MKLIRAFINFLVLATMPLWGGTVGLILFMRDLYEGYSSVRKVVKGEKFIWQ